MSPTPSRLALAEASVSRSSCSIVLRSSSAFARRALPSSAMARSSRSAAEDDKKKDDDNLAVAAGGPGYLSLGQRITVGVVFVTQIWLLYVLSFDPMAPPSGSYPPDGF